MQPFTRVLLAVLMCVVVLVAPSPSPAPAQEVPETAPPPGFAIVDPSGGLGVPLLSWPNGALIRTWPGGTPVAWLEGLQTAAARPWQRGRAPGANWGRIAQGFLVRLPG